MSNNKKPGSFVDPLDRVRFEGQRRRALLRQQKTRLTLEEFDAQTRALHEEEARELNSVRELVGTIGTGCECNVPPRNLEVENLLDGIFPNGISQLVCLFLPVNSTPAVELSEEQACVMKIIANGYNVFFTGDAGTGKSFILKQLRELMVSGVAFTALTGIAAINVQGTTLHAFAGVAKGVGSKEALLTLTKQNRKALERWRTTRCLIVDEVSMLSSDLFESLDYIARQTRRSDVPFGGIQLVFCGDFGQLPPVKAKYCFESELWNLCFPSPFCVRLTKIYRQKDAILMQMLNQIRAGDPSPQTMDWLRQLRRPLCEHDGILPTVLKCLNVDVTATNEQHLVALGDKKDIVEYRAQNTGDPRYYSHAERACNAEEIVKLRAGAQVMLIKNMLIPPDIQLCNGSKGVIIEIDPATLVPLVQFSDVNQPLKIEIAAWPYEEMREGRRTALATRHQTPLKLAWCTTIHKSQGLTLDRISVDLTGIFEPAMGYVALSRARSLRTMQVIGTFDERSFLANARAIDFASRCLITVSQFQTLHTLLIREPQGIWNTSDVRTLLGYKQEDHQQTAEISKRKSISPQQWSKLATQASKRLKHTVPLKK